MSEYKSVKIDNKIWMTENLNVDHYRNGDPIPEVKDAKEWESLKTGAWCYYDNNPENGNEYGKLYNWFAVNDPRGLAPKGWHIPSMKEFNKLIRAVSGNALNLFGQGTGGGAGTNTNGFSALLAGCLNYPAKFEGLGHYTIFWSSTKFAVGACDMSLNASNGDVTSASGVIKTTGCSVRCIKD